MRLLIDCAPLSTGGGVQAAIAFFHNLSDRDDIEWLAVVPEPIRTTLPPSITAGAHFIFVPKTTLLDRLRLRFVLQKIERRFDPGVVFTVFGPAYFRAKAAHVVGFARPNLIYERDRRITGGSRSLDKLADHLSCALLRQADQLIVETETVRDRLARRLAIPTAGISVIGNCVNPRLTRHTPTANVVADCFSVLVPSAYYAHKNLEIVPAVASAMRRLDPDLNFEFRFTLEPHGAPWRKLSALAHRLGVAHRMVTLGPLRLDDLASAYTAASAVFLPTVREASTAVYPESFYFRRPLVTSDLDFARELCGDAALFVPPHDPEVIATRMLALARTPEMVARLVASGERQLAMGYPTPDEKFAMQLSVLRSVTRGSGCTAAPDPRKSPTGKVEARHRDVPR